MVRLWSRALLLLLLSAEASSLRVPDTSTAVVSGDHLSSRADWNKRTAPPGFISVAAADVSLFVSPPSPLITCVFSRLPRPAEQP